MKKLLSYFFLILFLFTTIGYFPIFLLRQNLIRTEIKQQMKNSIPEKELIFFSFSREEYSVLKWEKENKEFHYENSMYDIVKIKIGEEGKIQLYCINDYKENQLISNLEKEVKKNAENSATGKSVQNIFKLLSNNFPPCCKSNLFVLDIPMENTPPFTPSFFLSFIGIIPSPPPKIV